MTAGELIEELKKYDKDIEVVVEYYGCWLDISDIEHDVFRKEYLVINHIYNG